MILEDKVVAITGAAGFLGRALVSQMLEKGAKVVVGDISPENLSELEVTLAAHSSSLAFCVLDITEEKSIEEFVERGVESFGHIDALVNNAYPRNASYGADLLDVNYSSFAENLSMNVAGYFLCSKVFSKYFVKSGLGNVINVASIYGVSAPKFDIYDGLQMTMPVEYSAIKASVIHMSKYMAKYFKGNNIRFNCISPGGIFDGHSDKFVNAYSAYCLNKGMLDPSDIVGTAVFLVSDDSQYINGQNIVIDDGFTI